MRPVRSHPWDLTPRQAVQQQLELASLVRATDDWERCETVAGIDVGIRAGRARAAIVVFAIDALCELEHQVVERPLTFPYVPGLLSFREAPVVLEALERLQTTPDFLMLDGQGLAHPRRLGIACHLGVLLDCPSIGCAKSRLCGESSAPSAERGAWTPLRDGETLIGAVVRTRTAVRPVYVSVGHRVSLPAAIDLVLRCGAGYRLPEPIRWAHRYASVL
jgi:deoxyribonuclease V